jgi:hypothetical protein
VSASGFDSIIIVHPHRKLNGLYRADGFDVLQAGDTLVMRTIVWLSTGIFIGQRSSGHVALQVAVLRQMLKIRKNW